MCFFKKKKKDNSEKPTKFIKFFKSIKLKLDLDNKSYLFAGVTKDYNDGPRLVIPAVFKGKPISGTDDDYLLLPDKIETIVFPDTHECIYASRFGHNVKRFEVSPTHPKYACVNGLITSKDGKTLLAVPGGVKVLKKSMLEGTSIVNLDPLAWQCTHIESIEVPANVQIIGKPEEWFFENTHLRSIIFDKDHPTWGYDEGVIYLKAGLSPAYKLIINPSRRIVFKSSIATRVLLSDHSRISKWYRYDSNPYAATHVLIFEEGITEIDGDVSLFPNLVAVYLPSTMRKLSSRFFANAKNLRLRIVSPYPHKEKLLEYVERVPGQANQSYNFIASSQSVEWAMAVYDKDILPETFPDIRF